MSVTKRKKKVMLSGKNVEKMGEGEAKEKQKEAWNLTSDDNCKCKSDRLWFIYFGSALSDVYGRFSFCNLSSAKWSFFPTTLISLINGDPL